MKSFFLAFQFLTIIPVPLKEDITERDIERITAFFPLVGIVQGGILFVLVNMLIIVLPVELTAACVLFLLVILSGGIHIDGLSDTCDALAVTGGTQEKRLSVMKDSCAGPIGVTAIVLVVLVKFLALKILILSENVWVYLMPLMGKWGILTAIFTGKPARAEGLGKIFFHQRYMVDMCTALICALAAVSVLAGWYGLVHLFIISLFSFLVARFFMIQFGGLTGDCLGALCELSEMVFMIIAVAVGTVHSSG
jgi:adenosylcobinamide-GDP ribazoletransferase